MADKMLDRISKALNQAERAREEGNDVEADTFMAKVQELATINGIDLAVARAHQVKKERVQEPEERRIQVNPYGRRHNKKHFVDLALEIAKVNDVRCLIGGNELAIFGLGFPEDLDVVEALFVHLSIQMVSECDEELRRGANKKVRQVRKKARVDLTWEDRAWEQWNGRTQYDSNPDDEVWKSEGEEGYEEDRDRHRAVYLDDVAKGREVLSPATDRWGNSKYRKPVPPPAYREVDVLDDNGDPIYEEKEVSTVDGRVFRHEFYEAFVIRMGGRLWEIRRSAEREAGVLVESSSQAVALRDKKKEVKDAHEERIRVQHISGSYSGASEDENRKRDYSGVGSAAGRAAAERVPVNEGRAVRPS